QLQVTRAAVQWRAVPGAPRLVAGGAPADHIHVQLRDDRVAWHGRVVREGARAQQPFLLAGVPHEQDRPLRLALERRNPLGDLERRDGAGAVVVGAVGDRVGATLAPMPRSEPGEQGIDARLLLGRGLLAGIVGAFRAHHVIPDTDRVVVDGRTAEPDVIVVGPNGDVLTLE